MLSFINTFFQLIKKVHNIHTFYHIYSFSILRYIISLHLFSPSLSSQSPPRQTHTLSVSLSLSLPSPSLSISSVFLPLSLLFLQPFSPFSFFSLSFFSLSFSLFLLLFSPSTRVRRAMPRRDAPRRRRWCVWVCEDVGEWLIQCDWLIDWLGENSWVCVNDWLNVCWREWSSDWERERERKRRWRGGKEGKEMDRGHDYVW